MSLIQSNRLEDYNKALWLLSFYISCAFVTDVVKSIVLGK